MTAALIGYSGFVGGTLRSQAPFDDLYRSTNIGDIAGRTYDLVVCAGAPAEKWKANRDPEADLASIRKLVEPLRTVTAGKVVLISTVDVYPEPVDVDESSPIDPSRASAYGRHRLVLEEAVRERFDALVVRLPGLYGRGLKKNAIFDLLHDNHPEAIHPDGVFQFYGVERLWPDVQAFLRAGLSLVNVACEPTSMRDVAREAFGIEMPPAPASRAPRYDFRTRYAERFGGRDGYLQSRDAVLAGIRRFVEEERSRAS